MSDQEHEQTKARMNKVSSIMLAMGGVLIIGAVALFIVGISNLGSGGFDEPFKGMGAMIGGSFGFMISISLLAYGFYIKMAARMGKITKFFAKETAPATRITTEAATDGIASGLSKHGMGIGQKEVVKVKCRNCGYLETEDAEFCSKCGQTI